VRRAISVSRAQTAAEDAPYERLAVCLYLLRRDRASVGRSGNAGWSLYGAQWSQRVASGGRWPTPKNGSDARKPLPWVARLPRESHGKEGVDGSSPSEGSAKAAEIAAFLSKELARTPAYGGYGAVYGAPRFGRRPFRAVRHAITPPDGRLTLRAPAVLESVRQAARDHRGARAQPHPAETHPSTPTAQRHSDDTALPMRTTSMWRSPVMMRTVSLGEIVPAATASWS
jgi:hypothetical protein